VLIVHSLTVPALLAATRGSPIVVRILVAAASIAPLGLLMGIPFACGARLAGAESRGLVAWGWAINGGASVFGSTIAMLVSMTGGFGASFLAGAGAYGVSLAMLGWLARSGAGMRAREAESSPVPVVNT